VTAVLVFSLSIFYSMSAFAYYGLHSTEADLEFQAYVDAPGTVSSVDKLNQEGSSARTEGLKIVEEQVHHLMGVFQSESLKKEFGHLGALGEDHVVSFVAVTQGSSAGRVRLTYHFKSKTVFDKAAFDGEKTQVPMPYIKLPLQPDLVYKATFTADGKNHCTDDFWQDREDFWYFFDPDKTDCPLRGDKVNVVRVMGSLTKDPNTTLTYPEYDRLYGNKDAAHPLRIDLFYGYIDTVRANRVKLSDENMLNMQALEAAIKPLGFEEDASQKLEKFKIGSDGKPTDGINFLHYWKRAAADGAPPIEIQILLSDTSSLSHDETFHTYLKAGLENTDLLVYDGHAGEGDNLNLNMRALQDVHFDPTRYQIFFLNGCSTYPYFKNMYFNAKGGSENLQLITSGLETDTSTSLPNMLAFLEGFIAGKKLTFQNIMQKLDHSNGKIGSYLYGVIGDQSSTWTP